MITIPKLRKETNSIKIHNEDLLDNYAWIKQKNWQEVLKNPTKLNDEVANYLTEENAFVKEQLKEKEQLETEIFQELKGRIKDKDSSVPLKDGAYYYFSEYEGGSEYPSFKRTNSTNVEETIFNAQKKSEGEKFFNLASVCHSHDHRFIAYNIDKNGSENYFLSVENLENKKILTKEIPQTTGEIIWDTDNKSIYYIGLDDNHRPNKIFKHLVGQDYQNDELIFEERDPAFFCSVSISQSKHYLLIRTGDHQTSEYYIKNLQQKNSSLQLFSPRMEKEEYEIDHSEGYF